MSEAQMVHVLWGDIGNGVMQAIWGEAMDGIIFDDAGGVS